MNGSSHANASAPSQVDEALRSESERIEALLEEIAGVAGPQTWQLVEELVSRLVGLYGAGLGRLLAHVDERGALDPELRGALGRDDLVASLLALHGLHPEPVVERIERALDDVRPYLSSHAGGVELELVDDAGTVHLRLLGSCHGCPSSSATVEALLREAIEAAAPEIAGIEVVPGEVDAIPQRAAELISIDVRRSRGHQRQRWIDLDGAAELALGELAAVDVGGSQVLAARLGAGLVAYRNACAVCGASLESGALDGDSLRCGGCGAAFDLSRGGRFDGERGPHLEPLPLLEQGAGHRIAIPGDA